MKHFTEAERAALIECANKLITGARSDNVAELAEIALAALTAEPAAYMYRDKLHSDARFSLCPRFGNWSPEDINEYEITETRLYTAPTVPALRLPDYEEDNQAFNYGLHALIDCLEDCGDAEQGLRLAIRAMRENATAPAEEKK